MNTQTNLNKIISLSLVALTATSLSFATIIPTKVAFAEPRQSKSVSPGLMNEGMNGVWNLQWRVNGWLHRGRLRMDGNFGTMIVNVTGPNGRKVYAEQQMNMVPDTNGYTLQGSRPTYPGSNKINPDYKPDNFYVEWDNYGNLEMRNCTDYHDCIPVKITK
ncbi:hypothetical protein [Okeania sp. SIO2B3]|uniref:hypothetical protein n=1 Tax=Okeania sp. SIO2B3 TaxID=2607784 RepID=UPI0013C0DF23|nr:hypothetical protein [Okeania sp. SIO2B3]NET40522.1 hypothetical protein [Okeania sp. SIO2B3]